jgi:hypothetical protein
MIARSGEGAREAALARHHQKAEATKRTARASGDAVSGTVPFSTAVALRQDSSLFSHYIPIMIRLTPIVHIVIYAYFL